MKQRKEEAAEVPLSLSLSLLPSSIWPAISFSRASATLHSARKSMMSESELRGRGRKQRQRRDLTRFRVRPTDRPTDHAPPLHFFFLFFLDSDDPLVIVMAGDGTGTGLGGPCRRCGKVLPPPSDRRRRRRRHYLHGRRGRAPAAALDKCSVVMYCICVACLTILVALAAVMAILAK